MKKYLGHLIVPLMILFAWVPVNMGFLSILDKMEFDRDQLSVFDELLEKKPDLYEMCRLDQVQRIFEAFGEVLSGLDSLIWNNLTWGLLAILCCSVGREIHVYKKLNKNS